LVSNHLIRKAAFDALQSERSGGIRIATDEEVVGLKTDGDSAQVKLASGEFISAGLVIAADSRFSSTRRMMSIPADMHDFGKSMLVCGMTHERAHHHTAWEWFGYGQTLALLPMNPDPETGAYRSSIVVTLAGREVDRLVQLDQHEFNREVENRFLHRLGRMKLVTSRHAYPLTAVYPRRFIGKRFATVGDAAVGMHPVTAHGFNFGLSSIESLGRAIAAARRSGRDFAADDLLKTYERDHRKKTLPLYLLTGAMAGLYTSESLPARALRTFLVRVGAKTPPFKQAIASYLASGAAAIEPPHI
jgi:ubiquinone biosynthesis UbiH/UbiF/VisC/COQ6 family hydroxylase